MFTYINGWSHSFRLSPLCNLWSFFVAPHLSGAWIFVRKVHLVSNQPGRGIRPSPVSTKKLGKQIPMESCVFFVFRKKHQWKQKKSKYIRMCVYVYLAEVKKERCTSNQKMRFFFWKKRFNLEDLLVSKRCFFFWGGMYLLSQLGDFM